MSGLLFFWILCEEQREEERCLMKHGFVAMGCWGPLCCSFRYHLEHVRIARTPSGCRLQDIFDFGSSGGMSSK